MSALMDHLTIAPILVPLLAGALMVLIGERRRTLDAAIGLASTLVLLANPWDEPIGATLEWGNDMGSLISQQQLDTVVRHVEDAVAKGARVLTGGKARPGLGPYFYEPTIL